MQARDPSLAADIRLFAGTANEPLARAVANRLEISLSRLQVRRFADSEIHVQVEELVRHMDVFVIQPCPAPVNDNLVELLLIVDALRRASARRINVIIPYYPYSRQDRMARGREAISAKLVARMLETCGVSRVVYVDIHALQTQGFFDIPVDPLTAMPTLAAYFDDRERFGNAVIVSPDLGRARLAGKYAERLGLPLVIVDKRRLSESCVESRGILGDLRGRTPIVIDDIIAGGSVLTQVDDLLARGAQPPVYFSITHPVLLPSALERLDNPLIAELVTTDTIAIPPEKLHPKIRVCSIAPLLAEAIWRIHCGQTMSPLLELL